MPVCTDCTQPCTNCVRPPCIRQNCPPSCNSCAPPCQNCPPPQLLHPQPPYACAGCPCNCNAQLEVISTVQIVESCPIYEELIINDVPTMIETNYTIYSTVNMTAREIAIQNEERNDFFKDEMRINLCKSDVGFRGDENQLRSTNLSTLPSIGFNNQTKGHVISNIVNHHNNNKPQVKPCQITSGWTCRKRGTFSHPTNCQKYIECNACGGNQVLTCPYEEAFDGKRCSNEWSQCNNIPRCSFDRELLIDPWDNASYFICIKRKGLFDKYFVFRRHCPNYHEFFGVKQQCIRNVSVVVVKPPCKKNCGYNDE